MSTQRQLNIEMFSGTSKELFIFSDGENEEGLFVQGTRILACRKDT